MTFDRGELLREAGYSEGNRLLYPIASTSVTGTTSSSSFQVYRIPELFPITVWDDMFPAGADTVVSAVINGDPGGDVINYEVENVTDGETMVSSSVAGSSTTFDSAGPDGYRPATDTSPIRFRLNFANGDNATSISIFGATIYIGARL